MQKFGFKILFSMTILSSCMVFSMDVVSGVKSLDRAPLIKNHSDIAKFFPRNADELDCRFELVKNDAIAAIQNIIAIPSKDRTFENTVLEFDKAAAQFEIFSSILWLIRMAYSDSELRTKANELTPICIDQEINLFKTNREIYQIFKEYQASTQEVLNEERAYYLSNLMEEFKRLGLELEDQQFLKLQELNKQIAGLVIQFAANMSQDKSKIIFTGDDLRGLDEDFINNLTKSDDGYVLGCDYPTASQVLSNCSVELTRQKCNQAFRSRAFPANIDVLTQLINTTDELANLLGYKSYAELDIAPTMAKTVDCAEAFLDGLSLKANQIAKETWHLLMNDLPESVTLTLEGQVKSWDIGYLSNHYLKKYLDIDQDRIAEYFPMERTVRGLLNIYEQFFNLKFQVINGGEFWDPSVQMIEVRNAEDDNVIGYVLVDLFPRENKYSHACCSCMVPPMSFDKGQTFTPSLAVVIANLTKSTENKPSLLKHFEVRTFFHEFGHAIHALFGKSEMPTKAGYNTKFDFVETPSKLLEEWIWDHEILKSLSCHYQTGESLSDEVIEQLIKTRTINEAIDLSMQIGAARLSLDLYKEGQDKNFLQLKKDAYDKGPQIVAYENHICGLCSFIHLADYNSKYYTYQWSEQLAKKLFNHIKLNGGLLDPVMGKRYISKVIGRGGSCDPSDMVQDFLSNDTK